MSFEQRSFLSNSLLAGLAHGQSLLPEAQPLKLAAVVVSFNRKEHIIRTVRRLRGEACDMIYVVDNGSTDGSREWLSHQADSRLKVIFPDKNLGGAGGFELAMRKAAADCDPDWIVLMDDDARPFPGSLQVFRQQDLSKWDAVAAAVFDPSGRICEINRPTLNPFWNVRTLVRTCFAALKGRARGAFHVPDASFGQEARSVDAASFVGLFVSRQAIRETGFPDGSLFIYGDDVLYTLGLRRAGLSIGFVPAVRFEHAPGQTGNEGRADGGRSPWKAYYAARNGLRVYRTAAGAFFWPFIVAILWKFVRDSRYYSGPRATYFRLTTQGLADALLGNAHRPHSEVSALAGHDPSREARD